eukprot:SAG31_NODE_22752_length_518_cov_1.484487_2_plen_126_part_01
MRRSHSPPVIGGYDGWDDDVEETSAAEPAATTPDGAIAAPGTPEDSVTQNTHDSPSSERSPAMNKFHQGLNSVRRQVRVSGLRRIGMMAVQQVHQDVVSLYGRTPAELAEHDSPTIPSCILHPDGR